MAEFLRLSDVMRCPTLLTREEADTMAAYLSGKDRDGLRYQSAPCAGMWVVEMLDADGKLINAL